jgi:hypothetical protein
MNFKADEEHQDMLDQQVDDLSGGEPMITPAAGSITLPLKANSFYLSLNAPWSTYQRVIL